MATHDLRDADTDTVNFSPAVPADLSALTRLSWELGSRVVESEEATLDSEWTHTETPRALSIFRATSNTVVVRVRTPVGRERFYGTTQSAIDAALPGLDAHPDWRRRS